MPLNASRSCSGVVWSSVISTCSNHQNSSIEDERDTRHQVNKCLEIRSTVFLLKLRMYHIYVFILTTTRELDKEFTHR